MNDKCVVLNSDFTYVGFITWEKAMILICKERVEVLQYSDKVINSFSATFNIPLIVRLLKLVRLVFKSSVPFSKKNVFLRDDFSCCYCGAHIHKPTIDHVVPQSKGGPTTWENIVTCCKPCNTKKKNHSCSEIKMWPKKKPVAPTISEFLRKKALIFNLSEFLAGII